MKRTAVLSALGAVALATAIAAPAQAAVTYSPVAAPIGSHPALDSSAGVIYSITTGGNVGTATGVVYLRSTDAKTLKVKSNVTLATEVSPLDPYNVNDVRVNSKTHTVWLLVAGGKAGSHVEAHTGSTGALQHFFDLDDSDANALAIDTSNGYAYVGTAPNGDGPADQVSAVKSLNPTTGAITAVSLPATVSNSLPSLAYDSANNGIYVSVGTKEFAYSDKLKLASTVTLGESGTVTVDGSAHTIYVAGQTKLFTIAGTTNKITRATALSKPGLAVIDPSIKTIYVGKYVYSTTNGAKTGTLPYAATSVNGSTHAIYSGTEYQAQGYAITRG